MRSNELHQAYMKCRLLQVSLHKTLGEIGDLIPEGLYRSFAATVSQLIALESQVHDLYDASQLSDEEAERQRLIPLGAILEIEELKEHVASQKEEIRVKGAIIRELKQTLAQFHRLEQLR